MEEDMCCGQVDPRFTSSLNRQVGSAGLKNVERPKGEIESALESQERLIAELSATIDKLYTRLSAVLREPTPSLEGCDKIGASTEVGRVVYIHNDRISNCIESLSSLRDRVEV